MSVHDPLCPIAEHPGDLAGRQCRCALIARVRADERERLVATPIIAQERAAVAEEIAQAIEEYRLALPLETPAYHEAATRSRDDLSWALAQARDIARRHGGAP